MWHVNTSSVPYVSSCLTSSATFCCPRDIAEVPRYSSSAFCSKGDSTSPFLPPLFLHFFVFLRSTSTLFSSSSTFSSFPCSPPFSLVLEGVCVEEQLGLFAFPAYLVLFYYVFYKTLAVLSENLIWEPFLLFFFFQYEWLTRIWDSCPVFCLVMLHDFFVMSCW